MIIFNLFEDDGETLLPSGLYDLVIKKAEERVSKQGNPYLNLRLAPTNPDYQEVDDLYHVIMLPSPSMGKKQQKIAIKQLKALLNAAGILPVLAPGEEEVKLDPSVLEGKVVKAMVDTVLQQTELGSVTKNRITRFVTER